MPFKVFGFGLDFGGGGGGLFFGTELVFGSNSDAGSPPSMAGDARNPLGSSGTRFLSTDNTATCSENDTLALQKILTTTWF